MGTGVLYLDLVGVGVCGCPGHHHQNHQHVAHSQCGYSRGVCSAALFRAAAGVRIVPGRDVFVSSRPGNAVQRSVQRIFTDAVRGDFLNVLGRLAVAFAGLLALSGRAAAASGRSAAKQFGPRILGNDAFTDDVGPTVDDFEGARKTSTRSDGHPGCNVICIVVL